MDEISVLTVENVRSQLDTVRQALSFVDTLASNLEILSDAAQSDLHETYARREAWELGSVIGRLESVNFHSGNECDIYTPFSGSPVRCVFPDSLTDAIQGNLRRRIEAFGKIHTPPGKSFPDRMEIHSIEILPETPARSLRSMRGVL